MSDNSSKMAQLTPLQQAGMKNVSFHSNTLQLQESGAVTILRLHSLEPAEQLASRFERHGVTLPLRANHSSGQDPAALCLRPNEWLVLSEKSKADPLMEQLAAAIDPAQSSLLNHSDGLATFRLSGSGAPWLLSKLSGLNYLAAATQGQHCARTRMADAAVVVHYHQPGDGKLPFIFDLLFDRSLAKYLWELLSASANHADELAQTFGDTT